MISPLCTCTRQFEYVYCFAVKRKWKKYQCNITDQFNTVIDQLVIVKQQEWGVVSGCADKMGKF